MTKKPSKNQEVIFPDDSHLVTYKILKKYKLERDPMKMLQETAQEMQEAKTPKEKREIAEKQPEVRLAKTIKMVAEGKIPAEDFSKKLQEIFNISPKIAKDIANDLEKDVLAFSEKIVIEEEVTSPARKRIPIKPLPIAPPPKEPSEAPPPPKPEAVPPEVERPAPPEKKPIPREEDTYREPLE